MNEQSVVKASGKRKNEHKGIVETKTTHIVISPKSTLAMLEIIVGDKQATFFAVNVFYNILIASIG
jgi:hypothetical protein